MPTWEVKMKSERKILIQTNRIEQLQKELQEERELVSALKKENAELTQKNIWLQRQADTVISEFKNEIEVLKSVKKEYSRLINDTKMKRKHYENKMADLLKRLKKQI